MKSFPYPSFSSEDHLLSMTLHSQQHISSHQQLFILSWISQAINLSSKIATPPCSIFLTISSHLTTMRFVTVFYLIFALSDSYRPLNPSKRMKQTKQNPKTSPPINLKESGYRPRPSKNQSQKQKTPKTKRPPEKGKGEKKGGKNKKRKGN